jgi:hypothetical protein
MATEAGVIQGSLVQNAQSSPVLDGGSSKEDIDNLLGDKFKSWAYDTSLKKYHSERIKEKLISRAGREDLTVHGGQSVHLPSTNPNTSSS